jgi:hypothetical protein
MGAYLNTTIASSQVVAAGGVVTGEVNSVAPAVGNYYVVVEEYDASLVAIPGSRSFIYQATPGGVIVNSTINFTVLSPVAVGEAGLGTVSITMVNTDCYLYIFLKQLAAVVVAGAFVAGTDYKIVSVGTTDFTLIGAAANVVGTVFTATGVGAGTGTACTTPDPDVDTTVDYVVITVQSSAGTTLDMSTLMNLMITMAIVVMMMKMMTGAVKNI